MKSETIRRFETPGLPFDTYEIVEVKFLAANTDTHIALGDILKTEDKSRLCYLVLSSNAPTLIYDSRNVGGGKAWTAQEAFLRSSVAPATVKVLFVVQRPR